MSREDEASEINAFGQKFREAIEPYVEQATSGGSDAERLARLMMMVTCSCLAVIFASGPLLEDAAGPFKAVESAAKLAMRIAFETLSEEAKKGPTIQ